MIITSKLIHQYSFGLENSMVTLHTIVMEEIPAATIPHTDVTLLLRLKNSQKTTDRA
jgi:hypothetical protein